MALRVKIWVKFGSGWSGSRITIEIASIFNFVRKKEYIVHGLFYFEILLEKYTCILVLFLCLKRQSSFGQ